MPNRSQRVLVETAQRLIRRGATANIQKILRKTHPADIAAIFPVLVARDQRNLFDLLDNDTVRGDVLGELQPEQYIPLLQSLEPASAIAVLKEMSTDDVADILGNLPDELSDALLAGMEDDHSEEVEDLLRYGDDTAGGIMVPEFIALPEDTTAEAAIQALRESKDVEMAFYVYVINDTEQLVGVLSLRQLVTVPPATKLRTIMKDTVITVRPEVDQEEVARVVARYNFLAVPVVDEANRLLGIVTVDDVIDVFREEATEDMLKMGGAGQEMVESRSVWRNVRARLPWLIASCVGGLLTALVMHPYLEHLEQFTVLALFVPIVLGMGGNVGTQSATIVVRGIAMGFIQGGQFRAVVVREVASGVLLGGAYGVVVGLVATAMGVWHGQAVIAPLYGVVVGVALGLSMTLAATIGAALPMIFDRLHIDPAVATGPFVTTAVDLLGTFSYFSLAVTILARQQGMA